MLLKTLTLTNVRAFSHAEFTFRPGMNLIVGINGVGKSTVLDTLRILLSQSLFKISPSRTKPLKLEISDITVGEPTLTANLIFEAASEEFQYLAHKFREQRVQTPVATGETPDRDYVNVDRYDLTLNGKKISNGKVSPQLLSIYFSARRALASTTKNSSKTYGLATAFADALNHRELRITELGDWWHAQTVLANEAAPNAQIRYVVFMLAVDRFLGILSGLHTNNETSFVKERNAGIRQQTNTILSIRKAGKSLDVRQLSDGERGILALVLDLARRLAQAYPEVEDPLKAEAVVLIDELDLHLHPQWQRSIVQKLTTTFPNCQFIATTHSPIIIGEVPPENIILIRQEGDHTNVIQSGLQGFGFDSSWILRHLMDTDSRNPTTQAQIDDVEEALEEGDLGLARQHLDQLKTTLHGSDDEVIRLEASINNLEALADALDTEE
jgi:predicted ATP-binding protein involved in virulence